MKICEAYDKYGRKLNFFDVVRDERGSVGMIDLMDISKDKVCIDSFAYGFDGAQDELTYNDLDHIEYVGNLSNSVNELNGNYINY